MRAHAAYARARRPTRVLHTALCCRVVLHIRGVTMRRARGTRTTGPPRPAARPTTAIELTTLPAFDTSTYVRTVSTGTM